MTRINWVRRQAHRWFRSLPPIAFACFALASAHVFAQASPAPMSADWEKVVAAAKKEGHVVVYSALDATVNKRIKEDFEKANPGIEMVYETNPSGVLLSKMGQERSAGADGADVPVFTEAGWVLDRLKEGAIKPPIGPNAAMWPAEYKFENTLPVIAFEAIGMAYNYNLVKTPPTSYADLLKPEFKDKLATIEIASTAVVAFYDWLEKTQGSDFLPKLAAQHPKLYVSGAQAAQMLGSGELAVSAFMPLGFGTTMINQGAPMKMAFAPSIIGSRYITAALGWSKRPNAAQVFLDYLMSRRGQTTWVAAGHAVSPLPNIPDSLDVNRITVLDTSDYPPPIAAAYKAKWEAMFKK